MFFKLVRQSFKRPKYTDFFISEIWRSKTPTYFRMQRNKMAFCTESIKSLLHGLKENLLSEERLLMYRQSSVI